MTPEMGFAWIQRYRRLLHHKCHTSHATCIAHHTSQVRGGEVVSSTVATYALSLRGSLYGGDLEICIMVSLFRMTAFLFNVHQWSGDHNDKLAPAVHQCSRRNGQYGHLEICLLWEENETGGEDHYSLLIPTRDSSAEFEPDVDSSDDDLLPDNLCFDMSRTDLQPTPPPSPNAINRDVAVPQRRGRVSSKTPLQSIDPHGKATATVSQPTPSPALSDVSATPDTTAPPAATTILSLSRMQEILVIVGCIPTDQYDLFLPIYQPWYQVNSARPRHTSHVTRHTSHVTRHTSHVTRHT